jgi:hypothetical protein
LDRRLGGPQSRSGHGGEEMNSKNSYSKKKRHYVTDTENLKNIETTRI